MRKVVAGPNIKRSNYDIVLTDRTGKKVGIIVTDSNGHNRPKSITRTPQPRVAFKTRTGEIKFDSYNEPWSPIAQEDWIGGRGNLEYDKDATKFLDSYRANTQYGYFSNGPLETYSTGIRTVVQELPGSMTFVPLKPGNNLYFASRRTSATGFTAKYLYLYLKKKGTPLSDLTIKIRADNNGLPGTVVNTITVTTTTITDVVSVMAQLLISPTYTVVLGTVFWIQVNSTLADDENCWMLGMFPKNGTAKCSTDGTTWLTSTYEMYLRIVPAEDSDVQSKFWKYHYTEYAAISIAGAAPKVYMNGDRGMADSNTGNLGQLVDATKSWTTDQWIGSVVKVIAGPGSTEYQNWRLVTSNNGTSVSVSPAWSIEHTTATEYCFLGADSWIEIASATHGLTVPVYADPMVINDIVYIPQGDLVNIRRQHWDGVGANAWSDDSTNKAAFLKAVRDSTNGLEVWRFQNYDATGIISASKSAVVDWGTGTTYFTFAAVIPFKDERGRFTNAEEYGDTTKTPWITREGSVYQIVSGKPDEIPLREIATMMDTTNGRAVLVHNVYFYFSYGQGIERYYDKQLDDVGPNRGQGMPTGRKGLVSCMVGYPGRFFVSIDAGSTGYSSVLVYNLVGYHEIYRAPVIGQRITHMDFQTVPGESTDRLWVQVGNDIISLNFPSGGLDPLNDTNSRYTYESTVTGSRMYVSMYDVQKLFRSFQIYADGLSDGQTVEMDYRLNEETAWRQIPDAFTGDVREIFPDNFFGVAGISMTYRLRILTNDCTKTIRGKALVVNNISRVPIKHGYAFTYRVEDDEVDKFGIPTGLTALEKQKILDEWAGSLEPLKTDFRKYDLFDNKFIFIDPPTLMPIAENENSYVGTMTMIEQ